MKLRLDEDLVEAIERITGNKYTELELEELEGIIRDLIYEYDMLEEEFEEYKEGPEEPDPFKVWRDNNMTRD